MSGRRQVFLDQAESAARRSPLYEELWRSLAEEPLVDGIVEEYSWDTPLRLSGGLHYLVLGGEASWDAVPEALVRHRGFLRRFVAEQPVQTNEVQRCWMLLPCFLEAARRAGAETLDLIELGPSAGLNLAWDRYAYSYERGVWGPAGAPFELRGEERRPVPAELLRLTPRVRGRVGIDRSPIDVTTEESARLLRAFVWPDQHWRLELLDSAIEAVRRDPPRLVRGDFAELLPDALAGRRSDGLTVVFETAVLGYLDSAGRRRVYDALAASGAEGPLAFVSNPHEGMILQLWPGGQREEVARVDFHGAWLEWLL
ncbi:MAG: DUF2332 domain-containing protein [Gaiellaceae bacterium]